jgi:carboxyl-terminal processing protease
MFDRPKLETENPKRRINTQGELTPLAFGLAVMIAIGIIGFAAGYVTATASRNSQRDQQFGALFEAWSLLNDEFYYDKPSQAEQVRGAIAGMVATLKDRYTLLIEPQAAAADSALMSGESGGIGARIMVDGGKVVISEVIIGKPAYVAGLLSGDVILSVDGVDVAGVTVSEAVQKVRGKIGTTVKLVVQRGTETRTFNITRDQINVYAQLLDYPQGKIAYVSVGLFDGKTAAQVQAQLEPLMKDNPRALILDLRSNPGGYLDQAVKLADLFLPEGVVVREKRTHEEPLMFNSHTGDAFENLPMVVLVDGNSASASEIVSGALKDRKRAVLFGQTTFGKGSVQSIHILPDQSQLRITSGAWYTPNDTPIKEVGLPVDHWVDLPAVFAPGTDPILDAAADYLLNGDTATYF